MVVGAGKEPVYGSRTMGNLENRRIARKISYEILKRAPQATTADATNTMPFFPDPSTLKPPPGSSDNNHKSGLAKSILEYLFLGVVLTIVVSVVLRRFLSLRRSNQPFTAFFIPAPDRRSHGHSYTRQNFPRTTGLPPLDPRGLSYPEPHLTGVPDLYRTGNSRRVHAQDVDMNGRRVGNTTELDHDGELGDKDLLPAYDNFGGPPKYAEIELQTRLFGNEITRPPPVEWRSSRVSTNVNYERYELRSFNTTTVSGAPQLLPNDALRRPYPGETTPG